jgi:hypothetical protein
MLVTMTCKFPNPCWFAINAQAPVESLPAIIDSSVDPINQDNTLAELNKYWDIFYAGWQSRPDKPGFLDKTLTGLVMEAVEFTVDVQIEVLNDIRHEKYKNKNLYTDVERERVDTIGFKPVWSPGGFQV